MAGAGGGEGEDEKTERGRGGATTADEGMGGRGDGEKGGKKGHEQVGGIGRWGGDARGTPRRGRRD